MSESYTLVVRGRDGKEDITNKITDICKNKRSKDKVQEILQTFYIIELSRGSEVKQYQLSTASFFTYGGVGIVLGLIDFTIDQSSPPQQAIQYVLKVDCSTTPGKIRETAIAINAKFTPYSDVYKDNMSLAYGAISGSSSSFAIYKYLGLELSELLFGHEKKQLFNTIDEKLLVTLKNINTEKYGRILADVYLDDMHLNKVMLEKRLAVPYDGGTKISPSNWMNYYCKGEL